MEVFLRQPNGHISGIFRISYQISCPYNSMILQVEAVTEGGRPPTGGSPLEVRAKWAATGKHEKGGHLSRI